MVILYGKFSSKLIFQNFRVILREKKAWALEVRILKSQM